MQKKKSEVVDTVRGFIGLAGPYDISDHYVFESERVVGPFQGVHEISTMKPAILGIENFAVHSPTALVAENKGDFAKKRLPKFHIIHGLDDTVNSLVGISASHSNGRQLTGGLVVVLGRTKQLVGEAHPGAGKLSECLSS